MSNNAPPPYNQITGIFTVIDKHQKNTKDQYDGNAKPGQIVVDTTDFSVWVGNADGNLNPLVSGSGNGTTGGTNTQIQFNDGGNFGGNAALTFNKTTGVTTIRDAAIANLEVTGNVASDLLPDANITYNLGSTTQRWKDIWLSNSTIYMGSQSISANATSVNFSGDIEAGTYYGDGSQIINIDANNIVGSISEAVEANFANFAGVANLANVAKTVAGANVTGTVANSTFATTAGTANTVAGANVTGWVANANIANTAGTVTTAAQPNITSVGTLTDLTVTGDVEIGDTTAPGATFMTVDANGVSLGQTGGQIISVTGSGGINIGGTGGVTIQGVLGSDIDIGGGTGGNINIDSPLVVPVGNLKVGGGTSGQVLSTDGAGNLSWTTGGGGGASLPLANGTSEFNIPAADGNVEVTADGTTWTFTDGGNLQLPGTTYDPSSPIAIRGDYGIILHPSHNTGGTGPELSISYNDGIEITPLTNDYRVSGTTAAPLYLQGAYISTAGVVPGSVYVSPGRNTTDSTYGNVQIGATFGGVVKLRGSDIDLGAVGNLTITGGTNGQVLATDGSGGLSWTTVSGGGSYSNANVEAYLPTYTGNLAAENIILSGATSGIEAAGTIAILPGTGETVDLGTTRLLGDITPVNAQGGNVGTGALPFFEGHFVNLASDELTVSGAISATTIAGNGANLTNITGANVTGTVASATVAATANSVAAANVVGIVANAAYAVTASTAEQIDGGNVYGEVMFAATANAVAGANVSGEVAYAAEANLVLGTNVSGEVAYADTANAVAGANVSGEVLFAATANAVAGANVSGVVANANMSVYADYVVNATQSNITAVGTLVSLDVTGAVTSDSLTTGTISATGNANVGNIGAQNAVFTGTGEFGGNLAMNNNNITGVTDPVLAQDAATKNYVDTLTSTGLSYHPAVEATTSTTLAISSSGTVTYDNGASGVGATLTTTGAFVTIDGVDITAGGTRILVKDELNAAWNGIYVFTNSTTLTRSDDADNYNATGSTSLRQNVYVFTLNGSVNVGVAYVCSTEGVITFGTTDIEFSQFSTSQVYTAGTGITINSTVIAVAPVQNQITAVGTLGALAVTGNAVAGNLVTGGVVSATGNVSGGNITTAGTVSATGNVSGGNITTAGTVTATGNVTGGNLVTGGSLTVATTANVGSLASAGVVQATGNVSGGNITTVGVVQATGNVVGGNLRTAGVLAVTGNANVGNIGATAGVFTRVTGSLTTNAQPNITSVGTLTTLAVSGNITGGNVAGGNLVSANFIGGTLTTAAQPNITSVGTLTSLTVGGATDLGDVAGITIDGGTTGQVLSTDGSGTLSWTTAQADITDGITANANYFPLMADADGGLLTNTFISSNSLYYNPSNNTLRTTTLSASTVGASTVSATNVNATTLTVSGNISTSANLVANTVRTRTGPLELVATGSNDISLTVGTGNIVLTTPTNINNLLDPTQAQQAATKNYVDSVAQGLTPIAITQAATTGTLASITGGTVTYDNGAGTLTLSVALTTLDGYSLQNGDRVLVHLEADEATNGVYTWATGGTVLTRATDADSTATLLPGTYVFVAEGTVYGQVGFVQTSTVTTLGTDPVVYIQFAAVTNVTAGQGIVVTGTQVSVDNTSVTPGTYGSNSTIPQFVVNSRGQITGASNVGLTYSAAAVTGNRLANGVVFSNLQTVGTLVSLNVSGNITVGDTVTATAFAGDGSQLTDLPIGTSLANGTSNVSVALDGAVAVSVGGTDDIMVVDTTGVTVAGTITGNLVGWASTVTTNAQPNITSVGTLTSLAVTGTANLGAVGNLTVTGGSNGQFLRTNGSGVLTWATVTASTAATVTANAQPNITSVGTLTTLAVSGAANLGSVGNIAIAGGSNGQVLTTNGNGSLSWTTVTATANTGNIAFDNSIVYSTQTNAFVTLDGYDNGQAVMGTGSNANAVIQSGEGGSEKSWTFDSTGNLTLPDGGSIYSQPAPISGNTIVLAPHGSGASTNQMLMVYPTAADGDHIHMATGNLYETELFLGTDDYYVKLANTGNIVINANDNNGNIAQWLFATDGKLTFPGTPRIDTADNNFEVQAAEAVNLEANTVVNIYTDASGSAYQWQFDNSGNLTLPGNTFAVNYANGDQVQLGGGGTVLPTNAPGYLRNDGAGALSWNTATVTAGSSAYTDVWVNTAKADAFWTEYTLTGTVPMMYDWQGTAPITLTGSALYGKQMSGGDKILVVNDGPIHTDSTYAMVVEFPASPAPGDTFQIPFVSDGLLVTAGSFVIGQTYSITNPGTTDFTAIGAANNNSGTVFTATGTGTGTGTATESPGVQRAIFLPATGQRAFTLAQGQVGRVEFGQGTTNIAVYFLVAGDMGGQPITWVYGGTVSGIPTWFQTYF